MYGKFTSDMSLCNGSIKLGRKLTRYFDISVIDLPAFLCPGVLRAAAGPYHARSCQQPQFPSNGCQRKVLHSGVPKTPELIQPAISVSPSRLPRQCAGCGAFSQTTRSEEPGYYSLTRKSVREYTGRSSPPKSSPEDEVIEASLKVVDREILKTLNFDKPAPSIQNAEPPICDRCHNLKHHDSGVSIHHPSIQSIQDTIFESPHKYNHVYHVIDAADFPMSLIPGLHRLLHLTPQRSLNRRSKTGRFFHGKKTEVSFIITRSDLLAPQKSQVDSMMPYLTGVLRDALGRSGQDVRLGNVRCVSAIRGWWTSQLKEDIWDRGGGGWMVGKVNVGKSQLFHNVFPKGRRDQTVKRDPVTFVTEAQEGLEIAGPANDAAQVEQNVLSDSVEPDVEPTVLETFNSLSLLPPAQLEVDYPSMPLVSALPGTTASPIRVPFGNGKGELIDLPGLSRGDLESYVQPEHRSSLVMRSRVRPEQQVIKPGQSLLLGGFIRITPTIPDAIILAYAFTPIEAHLTSTEKAIGTQNQTRESGLENISLPGVGEKIASAGTFSLKWDVTKQRTGPVTASDGAGIKVDKLPYRVLSTDILIEGCGWVELAAQIPKKPLGISRTGDGGAENTSWEDDDGHDADPRWPAVEVYTPEGKFIASRRPMNAWLNVAKKPASSQRKSRPRKSRKGVKKAEKRLRRITATS